jgi:hypothetical protein
MFSRFAKEVKSPNGVIGIGVVFVVASAIIAFQTLADPSRDSVRLGIPFIVLGVGLFVIGIIAVITGIVAKKERAK